MAVPFSNTKLRVPKGFQNILEGLAREVLRNQPPNVYEFGASYFESLLRTRAETGHDPALHGARLEDRTYNNHSFKKPGVDPSDPQQQEAALAIQTGYRQHTAQQQVEDMKELDAAVKIQAGFRGYIDRQEVKKLKDDKDSSKAGEEEEEVDIDLNDPAVEDAAIKIQAQFKGFKARKEIQTKQKTSESTGEAAEEKKEEDYEPKNPRKAEEPEQAQAAPDQKPAAGEEEEEVDIDLNDPEVEKAAIKIQAGFKGFKARKDKGGGSAEKSEDPAAPKEEASS